MALSFLNGATKKKRDQVFAIDLGARNTKAVLMERRGSNVVLLRYVLMDAPIYDKKFSPELLTEHLRTVAEAMNVKTKFVTLTVGLDDAVVRQVELPQMPVNEMRLVLKNNSKGYLQQDLPRHVFDCHIFPPKFVSTKTAEVVKQVAIPKLKVVVAGAKQQLVEDYTAAAKNAGLTLDSIIPGLLGPVNSFEIAMPERFSNDSVALVDIGFKHTSICVIDQGELILSRVVDIGGDKLTSGIAEAMNIPYAEAEGVKVGGGEQMKAIIQSQVIPLGRELRASLDFFEHQQDRPISQVYVSGGSTRSELVLETLKGQLGSECKTWSPTTNVQLVLPGPQALEIEQVGPQLAVAIGAALASM
jgi:type IV pilus assembly protein PilM